MRIEVTSGLIFVVFAWVATTPASAQLASGCVCPAGSVLIRGLCLRSGGGFPPEDPVCPAPRPQTAIPPQAPISHQPVTATQPVTPTQPTHSHHPPIPPPTPCLSLLAGQTSQCSFPMIPGTINITCSSVASCTAVNSCGTITFNPNEGPTAAQANVLACGGASAAIFKASVGLIAQQAMQPG